MYSAKNSLKAWISNASGPSVATTLAALPEGEIGFFDALGAVATTGPGYICYRKPGGQVLMSKLTTFSAAWTTLIQAYAAPTLLKRRITIPSATANTFYQIRVEMSWPEMQGTFVKHGNYKTAASGDTVDTIAAGLVSSLNKAFAREGKVYFTIDSATADDVDITAVLLPYVRGKKQGRPISFKMHLTTPESIATESTSVAVASDGNGYGPYICEQEFFAQGDHDPMRFGGYPNSFDDKALTGVPTGQYKTLNFTENTEVEATGHSVLAPQQYLLGFNTVGVGVVPIVTDADDSDNLVDGTCNPGDHVYVYVNGTLLGTDTSTPAGTFQVAGAITAGDLVTARAMPAGGGTLSAVSNTFTAVA